MTFISTNLIDIQVSLKFHTSNQLTNSHDDFRQYFYTKPMSFLKKNEVFYRFLLKKVARMEIGVGNFRRFCWSSFNVNQVDLKLDEWPVLSFFLFSTLPRHKTKSSEVATVFVKRERCLRARRPPLSFSPSLDCSIESTSMRRFQNNFNSTARCNAITSTKSRTGLTNKSCMKQACHHRFLIVLLKSFSITARRCSIGFHQGLPSAAILRQSLESVEHFH